MPRPADGTSSYLAGLDGIRAIAVVAVLVYHLNPEWLPGGLLGVGVFFTLSGYLITLILLRAWDAGGRQGLDLRAFYLRRVRRLLPAVLLVLAVVLLVTCITRPAQFGLRWGEAVAAFFYVANWHTISQGVPYFDRFTDPGPLDHLWSLAVEEQFYLVWPVLLLVLLRVLGGRLRLVAVVTALLAGTSFVLMFALASPGFDQTRVYEGTDTRAGGLLVGAVVALVWHSYGHIRLHWTDRALLDGAAATGLVAVGLLFVFTDQYGLFLYRGGILLLSLAAAAVVLAAGQPATWTARVLGVAPLRWLGERSYGIYLWHLPLIAFAPTDAMADQPLLRAGVLSTQTIALAGLNWVLVENPIRQLGFRAYLFRARQPARPVPLPWLSEGRVWAVGALALTVGAVGTLSMMSAVAGSHNAAAQAPAAARDRVGAQMPVSAPVPTEREPRRKPKSSPSPEPATNGPPKTSATPGSAARTACSAVSYVGDSTSIGLTSRAYIAAKANRLPARLRGVGVRQVHTDIRGARSIVERYQNEPNGQDAVRARLGRGFDGCWIYALGNNEAANVYVGGTVPLDTRIDWMMKPVGDSPVLWLTTKTLRTSGPYANRVIQRWTEALRDACARYPNLRVYVWAGEVKDEWFNSDRIHFSRTGWRMRASRIASAVTVAFPADGRASRSCFVGSRP